MPRIHALLAGAMLAGSLAAQTLVVPSVAAGADGNSSTGYPFDIAAGRLIYIYDSSHFTSAGVNQPILINQISWRANATTTSWIGATFPVQLDLSTSPLDYLNIDTTWDNNHGPDRATVFNGNVTIAAGSSTAGTPGPFHVTITFTQPFLYDPSVGDLTIDSIHSGNTTANTPTLDAVTTAGTALARRAYSLTNPPAATATVISGEIANVLEIGYTPASGLFASFSPDVTSGPSPLSVQFTDTSYSSSPTGVLVWQWDFDNDGTVDSTLQNPTHVFTTCGSHDVRLTIDDGVNPTSTVLRTALITTDTITADFTSQLVAPLTVLFNDTSDMPATSWEWDLDGDGVTDSTSPNPGWVYPNTAPVDVTLTVTRLCSPPSTITKTVIAAQQLTTDLAVNNGGASEQVTFDIEVLNPTGVTITAFDCVSATANAAFTCDIYLTPGTSFGNEFTPAPWTLVGQATGTSAPTTTQTALATLTTPLHIPAGTYGIGLYFTGALPRYVTGAGVYGNGDMTLTMGTVCNVNGPFTGSTIYTPRIYSCTLYYGTHNLTGLAGAGFFGPGCPGTLGTPHQHVDAFPQLGGSISSTFDNLPFGLGVIVAGLSNTLSGGVVPLPADLGVIGAPGCPLRVSADATAGLSGAGTTASFVLPVPNSIALNGALIYTQGAAFDPAANALGFTMSDAVAWTLGM
ncbi:MAG: PKD domain-containing protein [Planctomycetota bacterium]